jgi:hypothetical protein
MKEWPRQEAVDDGRRVGAGQLGQGSIAFVWTCQRHTTKMYLDEACVRESVLVYTTQRKLRSSVKNNGHTSWEARRLSLN